MKCDECGGACCESFEVPLTDIQPPGQDELRWVLLHGRNMKRAGEHGNYSSVVFDCRCTALQPDGKCGVYFDRPELCRAMPAGGEECLEHVKARRTPDEYARIRDDDDPERIH